MDMLDYTTNIVAAYVSANAVPVASLPDLIAAVHGALVRLDAPEPEPVVLTPALPVSKSVTPDYLVCLDDGKKLKSLKRHLAGLGMTPDEYRAKWGLPRNYPMVAPGYAAARSALAKSMGLGQKRMSIAGPTEAVGGGFEAGTPSGASDAEMAA